MPKPRNLSELKDNPFPIFPHEIAQAGPTKGCCIYCGQSEVGIKNLSLACTLVRERLRQGGY